MNIIESVIQSSQEKMENAVDHFKGEIAKLRSDRASAELIEDIQIDAYGQHQALKHVANITTAGPRTLQIDVWDQGLLPVVEKVLHGAGLGASPSVQGNELFLNLPVMSRETREQIVKVLHSKKEESKISLRNTREEGMKLFKKSKEAGEITEDDFFIGRDRLDKLIHEYNSTIESMTESKQEIIMM